MIHTESLIDFYHVFMYLFNESVCLSWKIFILHSDKIVFYINFRIDIVESEFGKHHRSGKQGRHNQKPKLHVETDSSPAFICEKVYMQIDFKKITDLAMDKEKAVPLYMSR